MRTCVLWCRYPGAHDVNHWYFGAFYPEPGILSHYIGSRHPLPTFLADYDAQGLRPPFAGLKQSYIENHLDSYHYWSFHSGGANFIYADGSVHFLPYSADSILPVLSTRAAGDLVQE